MAAKLNFKERLAELARENEAPLRGEELVQSRLRWEDWGSLRPEAVAYAREQIRRRRWRGVRGGLLPRGYEGEDVADAAIGEMLEGKCRLAIGWTRERLVRELRRLVEARVRALHRLHEAATTRSEWEEPGSEGEQERSAFESLVDERVAGDSGASLDSWKGRFEVFLKGEPELLALFECLCSGVEKRRDIAAKLGLEPSAVTAARKRLERRLGEFRRQSGQ